MDWGIPTVDMNKNLMDKQAGWQIYTFWVRIYKYEKALLTVLPP